MDQAVLVQMLERRGKRQADAETIRGRQTAMQMQFTAEIARRVGAGVNVLPSAHVIRHFHHVVESATPHARPGGC